VLGGLVCSILAPLLSGGAVVPMCEADPHALWQRVEAHSATWLYISPSRHAVIYHVLPRTSVAHASLRLVLENSESIRGAMGKTMSERYSSAGAVCVIISSYGSAECMPIAATLQAHKQGSPGTCGAPLGPAILIADSMGVALPPGSSGRILLQGQPLMKGYEQPGVHRRLRGLPSTAHFNTDGWFDTGDIGYLDKEGWLYITNRAKRAEAKAVLRAECSREDPLARFV